ncbi:MAG TPA: thiamine pyrophosphate-dependent enzyme [Streptosporangiaceae bacterium]|nr:thiamine pyrophosphate-dependent enzyme [Streptosporangiaceae bacterium]
MTARERHGTHLPAPSVSEGSQPAAAATLAASLRGHGVDRVFCVAGESYLGLLDALAGLPGMDVVTCRHEGSAAFMALADARLAGRAGVCLVSRGPGAANASIGVHAAWQDATPLVLIVGQVATADLGREVFQEVDAGGMFSALAKAVVVLHDPARTAEMTARAFRIAETGTPGPVVLVTPADVLTRPDPQGRPASRWPEDPAMPGQRTIERAQEMLAESGRPLLIAGGRLDSQAGRHALAAFAARRGIPVVTSNKHQDLLDNKDPRYAGHLHNATPAGQLAALGEADLILAVGTRLDEVTTRRQSLPAWLPCQRLVHVYPDAARLGLRARPDLGVSCDPAAFLQALADGPAAGASWLEWAARLHAIELAKSRWEPAAAPDGVVFGAVVSALDTITGGDVTVVVDSGTFTSWVYRYLRFSGGGRLLGLASSPMGSAVPAAVAVAMRGLSHPVVAVAGDGGFLMNGSELVTAVARKLPVVVIVADNCSYATIRMHQEREYPGRVAGTDLVNPDFAALASAHGALGLTVTDAAQAEPALRTALECGGPALIHVHASLSWITAYRRLDGVTARRRPPRTEFR